MYYGFRLAAALWVYYGLTLGLKAGIWGFFAPEISAEIELSTTQIGLVAGVLLGGSSIFMPLAGVFMARFGTRKSMFLGLAIGAAGILTMSRGTAFAHFLLAALMLAASTSFAGVLPIVTLTTHWFDRYRSRVMAAIFTASPLWGALSYPLYSNLLDHFTWRATIAGLTAIIPAGLLIVLLAVKNRPADIGQPVDGISEDAAREYAAARKAALPVADEQEEERSWTARTALMSIPFALVVISSAVANMPYLFFLTYGRLFLASGGIAPSVAVGALMSMTIASLVGRLLASLADFIDARLINLLALVSNLAGVVLIALAKAQLLIYLGAFLLGMSFGLTFLLPPLLIARYFGPKLFSAVEGVRAAMVIAFGAALTPLFGFLVDRYGSYTLPLVLLFAMNALAVVALAGHSALPLLGRIFRSRQNLPKHG